MPPSFGNSTVLLGAGKSSWHSWAFQHQLQACQGMPLTPWPQWQLTLACLTNRLNDEDGTVYHAENGDDSCDEEQPEPKRRLRGFEDDENDEDPIAGLIEWLKDISLEDLAPLEIPPAISGLNDTMTDNLPDDSFVAEIDDEVGTKRRKMTYAVFSDEPMLPPEPKFHGLGDINSAPIVWKQHCLVGGREKFLAQLGISTSTAGMSRDAADTLATMGTLESAGVFRDLQASILETKNQRCACFRVFCCLIITLACLTNRLRDEDGTVYHAENGDDSSDEEQPQPKRQLRGFEDDENDEDPNAGLIEWLKDISLEDLALLEIPPVIPGLNDIMTDDVPDDSFVAEIDDEVGAKRRKMRKVKISRGKRGAAEIASACNGALSNPAMRLKEGPGCDVYTKDCFKNPILLAADREYYRSRQTVAMVLELAQNESRDASNVKWTPLIPVPGVRPRY